MHSIFLSLLGKNEEMKSNYQNITLLIDFV